MVRLDGEDYPFAVVTAFALRHDADQAFAWIDKALAQSRYALNGAIENPALDNLRNDPRWLPTLRKVGQTPEQLAAIKFDVVVPGSR